MRKWTLVLILAAIMVVGIAATASAALAPNTNAQLGDGKSDYLSPTTLYYPADPVTNRIHSQYQANTDACASCHATHTAVGPALLQWADVNDACLACHDGTVTSTYNVDNGYIANTSARTLGGLFLMDNNGSTPEGTNSLSRHGVSASTTTSAAPGGGSVDDEWGKWASTEFTCAACHSPHGQGGNARILNPDPNGLALAKKIKGFTLTDTGDTVTFVAYVAYVTAEVYDFHRLGYTPGDMFTWIEGYPYSKDTKVYVDGDEQPSSAYTIDNSSGYTKVVFDTAPTGAVTADFVPAVRVAMAVTNYLQSNESVAYKRGINAFCGSCHLDYNTANAGRWNANASKPNQYSGSGEVLTGIYREAYRHQVGYKSSVAKQPPLKFENNSVTGENTVVCLTCHVAHGVDEGWWVDMSNVPEADATEQQGSSALKRQPNMGVCETCHQKGAGNGGYAANTQ